MLFHDRAEAGRRLAGLLRQYAHRPEVIVLALPRGGVPVAAEVATAIEAPLDVWVVRKLGLPGSEETAMGAIASGDFQYLNRALIQRLKVQPEVIEAIVRQERQELSRRELAYRDGLPALDLEDRVVILVDDGLATGATMQVVIEAIQQEHPRELVAAVPVAAEDTCQQLGTQVDRMVCAETPSPFYAVGLWYEEFSQTTDAEVRSLLEQGRQRMVEAAGSR